MSLSVKFIGNKIDDVDTFESVSKTDQTKQCACLNVQHMLRRHVQHM